MTELICVIDSAYLFTVHVNDSHVYSLARSCHSQCETKAVVARADVTGRPIH